MERKVKVVPTREPWSCNACQARNYGPSSNPSLGKRVDILYEVRIGTLVPVLCSDCLNALKHEIEEAIALNARPPP